MVNYTIVLNSENGTGARRNDKVYPFDFTGWEDGEYELRFTYASAGMGIAGDHTFNIFANLGTTTVFTTENTNYANTTQYIGNVLPLDSGTAQTNYLYANKDTNTEIFLFRKPLQQDIHIRIMDEQGNPSVSASSGDLSPYMLKLHFQKV